jgi:hypothetical protein
MKGVMKICISKKYRQPNGQKKKDTQHTHKTAKRVTRTPLKTGGEITCSGRVSSSCSTMVLCFCFVCLRLVHPMLMLTRKLLNKRFLLVKLKSSLRMFYGHHYDLVTYVLLITPWVSSNSSLFWNSWYDKHFFLSSETILLIKKTEL